MSQDRMFDEPKARLSDFRFGEETVSVFDDMVERSVPFYPEIQRMTAEIAADFAVDGTNLYDLGCSTGTTLMALDPVVSPGVRFVGVDNPAEMLEKARQKLSGWGLMRPHKLIHSDLHEGPAIENASVVMIDEFFRWYNFCGVLAVKG